MQNKFWPHLRFICVYVSNCLVTVLLLTTNKALYCGRKQMRKEDVLMDISVVGRITGMPNPVFLSPFILTNFLFRSTYSKGKNSLTFCVSCLKTGMCESKFDIVDRSKCIYETVWPLSIWFVSVRKDQQSEKDKKFSPFVSDKMM